MADTGFLNPASAEHVAGGNNDWADATNVLASDDAYATVVIPAAGSGTDTDILSVTFNVSMRTDATVNGIEVAIEAKMNTSGAACTVVANVVGFSSKVASVSGNTDTTYTYGGELDKWGASSISGGDVSPTVEVQIHGERTDVLQRTLSVDHVKLKIYYTLPPSSQVLFWSAP